MSVGLRGLHFKAVDFTGLVNFEQHSQNEVTKIGILVLWRVYKNGSTGTNSLGWRKSTMFVCVH